jgi:hypothetical protein
LVRLLMIAVWIGTLGMIQRQRRMNELPTELRPRPTWATLGVASFAADTSQQEAAR